MLARAKAASGTDDDIIKKRNKLVLEQARAAGLLDAPKDTRISGRLSASLVKAAKRRAAPS